MPPVGWHLAVELSVCPSKNLNVGHNFCNIEKSNLIFGMHVYLIKLHILNGDSIKILFLYIIIIIELKS